MRLVLLLLLIGGVAGMHTIGHPTDPASAMAAMGSMSAMDDHSVDAAVGAQVDGPGSRMVMHPLNVCLAVLVSGFLLLLAALLVRVRRARLRLQSVPLGNPRAGRGPPGSARLGLVLADLSVQRT